MPFANQCKTCTRSWHPKIQTGEDLHGAKGSLSLRDSFDIHLKQYKVLCALNLHWKLQIKEGGAGNHFKGQKDLWNMFSLRHS